MAICYLFGHKENFMHIRNFLKVETNRKILFSFITYFVVVLESARYYARNMDQIFTIY